MFPFLVPQSISDKVVIAATKTMLKVAHTDGLHPAEAALIEAFYRGAMSDTDATAQPSFASLSAALTEFKVDASDFSNDQEREMVLALSVMTGFADGDFSAAEQQIVQAIASSLQIADARYSEILEGVKDHMLAQLSHLPDAASVAVVAKELG